MVYAVDHFVRAGETLSSDRLERFCGGKGLNQSVALARAGAEVLHAGCIGRDGGMLLDLLAASGADTRFVRQLDEASGHAIIQVDKKGQNCILLYGGANMQDVYKRQGYTGYRRPPASGRFCCSDGRLWDGVFLPEPVQRPVR